MSKRRLNGEGTIVWHKRAKQYMVVVMNNGVRTTAYDKTMLGAKKKLRELQRKQEDGIQLVESGMFLKNYPLDLPQGGYFVAKNVVGGNGLEPMTSCV